MVKKATLYDAKQIQDDVPSRKKPGRKEKVTYKERCTKKCTLMMPEKVHRTLRIKSAEDDVPIAKLIIDALIKQYRIAGLELEKP